MPSDTYAYSSTTPLAIHFDREVSFDLFWLRLHRSPKAFIQKSEGTRKVQILRDSQVVAEATFLLTSDEWVLIKPSEGSSNFIGNELQVEANTDIDSIVVSWGD